MDNGKGEVRIIEFADYECPFCRTVHAEISRLIGQQPDIGVAFRHLPLTTIHRAAEGAARASVCAEQQGRFREMHDRLLLTTEWQPELDWLHEARAVGITDTMRFRECLTSESTTSRLAEDKAFADSLGLRGTPAFVFQRGVHSGVASLDELVAMARLQE